MNVQHGETIKENTYNASFHKLMRMFTLSVLISFVGTVVGMKYVPTALMIPLTLVELGMLVFAYFLRKRKAVGYPFVFIFCFISGITVFPAISHWAFVGGAALIKNAFLLTVLLFAGLTLFAYYSRKDFSFLRGFLMAGVLALIGISIVGMFTGGFGGPVGLVIAFAGIMIFSGFVLYDISQYRYGLPEEAVPLAVLGLYLNFINIFLYLLRFLGILSED